LRGLRTSPDFEFERAIAHMNKAMQNSVETIFLLTDQEHTAISSTIVREILKNKGDVSQFVPNNIYVSL
jgi:pantetheine-phosphate adenylyltransferase